MYLVPTLLGGSTPDSKGKTKPEEGTIYVAYTTKMAIHISFTLFVNCSILGSSSVAYLVASHLKN